MNVNDDMNSKDDVNAKVDATVMQTVTYYLPDEDATTALGASLMSVCQPPLVIHLIGELGTGKTCLTRGLLRAFGISTAIRSPTFTLVEHYELATSTIYHMDLYRLTEPEELHYLGIRDYLDNSAVCIIEWPELGGTVVPPADLRILFFQQDQGRRVVLEGLTLKGQQIIQGLENSHASN